MISLQSLKFLELTFFSHLHQSLMQLLFSLTTFRLALHIRLSVTRSDAFRFAVDGASAYDMALFYFPGIQGYTCFWNNYSTAIFKTFLKGPCYHDNLITQWLPKGAFGLVTRKFIWGFCSSDWWLECLKSVLSSEIPLTVPWGPAGRGPAGWWMRIYKQQTLPSGVSTLISPTRSIHEASTT